MKYFIGIIGLLITAQFANAQKATTKFQLIGDIYNDWKLYHINIPQTACDTFFYASAVFPTVLDQLKQSVSKNKVIFKQLNINPRDGLGQNGENHIIRSRVRFNSIAN
jgi:hypothetical protein